MVEPSGEAKKTSRSLWSRLLLLALGVAAGLALAEFVLYVVAGIYLARRDPPPAPVAASSQSLEDTEEIRILCLGESTTAGLLAGKAGSYPRQLEGLLNASSDGRRFAVVNEGRPAIDTSYILDHLEENLDRHEPHLVVAMIGINDGPLDAAEFQVGGGPRLWKLARLAWMVLTETPESPDFGWADAFAEHNMDRVPSEDDSVAMKLLKSGDRQGALRAAEEALGRSPVDPRVAFEAATALLAPRNRSEVDVERAETLLLRAHESAPCRTRAALSLFQIYAADQPDRALDWAATAIGCAPGSPGVRGTILFDWLGVTLPAVIDGSERPALGTPRADRQEDDAFLTTLDGMLALRRGDEDGAIDAFRRAFSAPGQTSMASETYLLMVDRFAKAGRPELALRMLDAALEAPKPSDRAYGLCAQLRADRGEAEEAERCLAAARATRSERYSERTRRNYQRLHEILRSRGIPLIAMQYPTRSVAPLERMLDGRDEVFFVSNEETFADAATAEGRSRIFVDLFAGDFGHMTDEGHRRVAENLAGVIREEVLETFD